MKGSKDGGEARDTGRSEYSRSPARAGTEAAERATPSARPRSPPLAAETWSAVRSWGLWPGSWGHRAHPRGGERTGAARRCGDLHLSRAPPARLLEAQKSSISGSRVAPEAGHRPLPPVSTPEAFSSGPSRGATRTQGAHTRGLTPMRTRHLTLRTHGPGSREALVPLPAGGRAVANAFVSIWPRSHL